MGRDDLDKKLIGLYGEMELAIKLHKEGWQVYRAYIDELIDFVISRYYCLKCKKYTELYIKKTSYKGKNRKTEIRKCRTNLCNSCQTNEVEIRTKFIQVKSSAGNNKEVFHFHPKLSHDIKNIFCVWIFIKNADNKTKPIKCNFFIFEGELIKEIDNINLDSYQITDNQKIGLKINGKGNITGKGNWTRLNDFKSFKILE
ncbi:MAG: hypothetical protein OXJ52_01500 [Oligoflexia bacterium]|nr:hypothetical protein [Oligoflexia bacterium]